MASKEYLHSHPQFEELVRIVADEEKIDPYLVEKDYWIMHCLYGLQQAGYDFQLKGGTSLSKGFKIIDRFSEDIDLYISPPDELDLKVGKNNNKKQHIKAREAYYDQLATDIKIEGITVSRDREFDNERMRSGGIRLHYYSHFPVDQSAAKDGVLLEVGFDDVAPNQPVDISSWAYDFAIAKGTDVIDNRAVRVLCYNPSYTFVEKLQAIATKYRKYQDSLKPSKAGRQNFPANFLRHYYDVYSLLALEEVQEFIGTDAYKAHKKKRFSAVDYAIPINENQAFLLEDKDTFEEFEKEYRIREPLYYKGQPSLREILSRIKENIDLL